jgi:hypothetical protein
MQSLSIAAAARGSPPTIRERGKSAIQRRGKHHERGAYLAGRRNSASPIQRKGFWTATPKYF